MTITATIIRAYARSYTEEQLQEKLLAAQEELSRGTVILKVQSGAGTCYDRALTLHPAEAVELYQRAIDLRRSGDLAPASDTQIEQFVERTVC